MKLIQLIYNKCVSWIKYAGLAELADASDLSSAAERRRGSSPLSRTNEEFDEAVYLYKNFNIELPEEFEQEYQRRYL